MKQTLLTLLVGLFLLPQISSAQKYSCKKDRAFFGISFKRISSEKANKLGFENPYGSYVAKVINHTAAKEIGIQPFDYIIGINEEQTSADKGFVALLCKYHPKEKVKIHFIRNGELKSSEVILGSAHQLQISCDRKDDCAFWGVGILEENLNGVKIKVIPNSSAEKMELQDGDLVTKINNHPILDWTDLSIAISNLKPNDLIQVEFIRANKRMISSGHIGEKCKKNSNTDLGNNTQEDKPSIAEELRPEKFEENFGPYEAPEIFIEEVQSNELTDSESSPIIELSLTNDLKIEKLNLYPGTEQGVFYLSFLLPEFGNTSIKLYNETGSLVYQYDLNDFGGTFRDELDLSDTPRGTYFMEITQNNKSVNKKITLL